MIEQRLVLCKKHYQNPHQAREYIYEWLQHFSVPQKSLKCIDRAYLVWELSNDRGLCVEITVHVNEHNEAESCSFKWVHIPNVCAANDKDTSLWKYHIHTGNMASAAQ
jgi:hypothetical protein